MVEGMLTKQILEVIDKVKVKVGVWCEITCST